MELFAVMILKIVLLLLIVTNHPVCSICTTTYDSMTCLYKVDCMHDVQLQYWDSYRLRDGSSSCKSINHAGYSVALIHLSVHNVQQNSEFYVFYQSDSYRFVISLDLSINSLTDYIQIPSSMTNLKNLILSRNLLSTLKLTNRNPLPSLRLVDLSYNIINASENLVMLGEHMFTDLQKINLSHNILNEIPNLKPFGNLENIDLSFNSISKMDAISFEGLMNLVSLNLSNNQISDLNSSLFRFKNLKTLKLNDNKITDIKSHEFQMLTKLEYLDLSNNLISNLGNNIFSQLMLLSDLNLSNNEIKVLEKDAFANIYNIKRFDVSKNIIKSLPVGMFKGNNIDEFNIEENQLEGSVVRGMFDGLCMVDKLDLSNQHLVSIEDYAFYGLEKLETLILQSNNIQNLTSKCFMTLKSLKFLDLSLNRLTEIVFETQDLLSLESLSLKNNQLTSVKHEHFLGLNSLQYLDLSNNNIKEIQRNSFERLKYLINFGISNNPLDGVIKNGTFEGLSSLPRLDISSTLFTSIQNKSFNGMTQLVELNISHSQVSLLQFNAFINTGSIQILDLSYNNLSVFYVNSSNIPHLDILFLNNNHIKTVDSKIFQSFKDLSELKLSFNKLEFIDKSTFVYLYKLRSLDLSYNEKLNFNPSIIRDLKFINSVSLSGIKKRFSFDGTNSFPLQSLLISDALITDVNTLLLSNLVNLFKLVLSCNKIVKLEYVGFANLTNLKTLDVSYNNISYIQPGTFKDSNKLVSLNMSHNSLTAFSYGIFKGLIFLNTLDASYNSINNIEKERFHETFSLNTLIVDHNKVESIDFANVITGTQLSTLSIGNNPIPCEALVKFQQSAIESETNIEITAIELDYHNGENIHGIVCNKKVRKPYVNNFNLTDKTGFSNESGRVLVDIRDILLNKNDNEHSKEYEKYLSNITFQMEKSVSNDNKLNSAIVNLSSNFNNMSSQIVDKNDKTNTLLERILRVLTVKTTPAPITKENATYDNLLQYINNIKQSIEDNLSFEKNNILTELDNKVGNIKSDLKNNSISSTSQSPTKFIEICVGLILTILVCIIVYKFYKYKYFRKRLSISTRELPSAMDSTL